MKLKSSILKQKIADKIKADNNEVLNLWEVSDRVNLLPFMKKLENPKNWKRVYKEKCGNTITRGFQPNSGSDEIDEQLNCFIETTTDDMQILSIIIEA